MFGLSLPCREDVTEDSSVSDLMGPGDHCQKWDSGPQRKVSNPICYFLCWVSKTGEKKKSIFLWFLVQIISCVRFRALWAPRLKVQTPLISLLQITVSSHRRAGQCPGDNGLREERVTDTFAPSCEVPLFSAKSTNVRPTPILCSVSLCFPPDCTPKTLQAIRRNAVCFVLQAWFKMGLGGRV